MMMMMMMKPFNDHHGFSFFFDVLMLILILISASISRRRKMKEGPKEIKFKFNHFSPFSSFFLSFSLSFLFNQIIIFPFFCIYIYHFVSSCFFVLFEEELFIYLFIY
ncbi:hypothetical protein DFH28DRAFT_983043, partial [Melampsora americana]